MQRRLTISLSQTGDTFRNVRSAHSAHDEPTRIMSSSELEELGIDDLSALSAADAKMRLQRAQLALFCLGNQPEVAS